MSRSTNFEETTKIETAVTARLGFIPTVTLSSAATRLQVELECAGAQQPEVVEDAIGTDTHYV